MILIHLESRDGETLVRLPDGSTRWVPVSELIALAKSDKAEAVREAEAPANPAPAKKATPRKKK